MYHACVVNTDRSCLRVQDPFDHQLASRTDRVPYCRSFFILVAATQYLTTQTTLRAPDDDG